MEKWKLLIGKYVVEHGGAKQVFEAFYKHAQIDTPKEKIMEFLNECKYLYKKHECRT